MLEIINNGVGLAQVVLLLILWIISRWKHGVYNNVTNIKVRMVISLILFTLYILGAILAVMLGYVRIIKAMIYLDLIIWAIISLGNISELKNAKKDLPDVDCTEAQDGDDES